MKRVKEFLKDHWDGQSPLLLGYSGGPDSKALLYSLLEAGCNFLHVAHVDHGWREESRDEEELVRQEMERLNLPYYTTRLEMAMNGNNEAVARRERLRFFVSLFGKNPFQALILGHHADDLAETALKRLFEGAHLPFLGGMEPISMVEGMPVWRPFLQMEKRDLSLFLEQRELSPFIDPTNLDPLYLRSRLRLDTLPFLDRSFGKNVRANLCHLSDRAHELRRYLDKRIEGFQIRRGEWGIAIRCDGYERIEQRHMIHKTALSEGLLITRTVLEPLLDWVLDRRMMKKIFCQSRWIVSGRGWVFFLLTDEQKTFPGIGWVRKLLISF